MPALQLVPAQRLSLGFAQSMRGSTLLARGGKRTGNIQKDIGVTGVEDEAVRNNLAGTSRFMAKKDWRDSQGQKGKGYGVYRFANKYGGNIDSYSPIYTTDNWSDSGNTFSLGPKGLIAWLGLVAVLLAAGGALIFQTSVS